ncbi:MULTISPECIES: tryptophan 2,3-dioxygenase [unclassified Shewanella]|uniref:tryptophan 2,3-dioxygenase n=1 Tax=unclassified Shewanella TaxID=196818 RepID=UPI000C865B76|nr:MULTISPECIES: tryptophan 2,3-dioxygenase [unclassified Shewanella]MDO6620631.1 tryptophan 2,3-dioxygenase [Shewanella sp. 6_MG-2023]MDO6639018.1 tryptophan 2,3-dioxygenase [Shewanella sp. 5_MG-2023]MDO6677039.1 tryptophan 2,3-dioxygenase [Shewanella sp. 4_MG-2023]PMG28640.1 tryptophan 2,3-dioxygenase [Shewanella sp. 10N.286.52.C2]PMG40955.1 tryptophan 2,3-dioxygenase [Shewanella sp. 10N.286.52.B9]
MSCPHSNYRAMEEDIHTDFKDDMSYGDYLQLNQVLSAQQPLSDQHDEMLFIVIHQSSELWLKLAGHELSVAITNIQQGDFGHAFKVISRVKQIFNQLTQSWNILSTLTPVDYLKFRDSLGHSSGFQSYGYRKLEFLLGNKNASLLKVHESDPVVHQELTQILEAPSLYDVTLKVLHERGLHIEALQLNRDFSQPYERNDSVLNAWLNVYQNADEHFQLYELAEKLIDIEDSFQQWRFKHMYTVQRIIGNKMGTGGSSGVGFLKKALDISFFPELFELRTHL